MGWLWTDEEKRIEVVAAENKELREKLANADADTRKWQAQAEALRQALNEQTALLRRAHATEGEFLALTREVSGLRSTVEFLTGHLSAVSAERATLIAHLTRVPVGSPEYQIAMAEPTEGERLAQKMGRTTSGPDIGDALNRLRDLRERGNVQQAVDELGLFDDQPAHTE